MTLGYQHAKSYLAELLKKSSLDMLAERLRPKTDNQPPRIPRRNDSSQSGVDERWKALGVSDSLRGEILDDWSLTHLDHYSNNIEHLLGTVKIPVGLAGPLRVNGLFAQGDFYVPLATTEASLVASYSRGSMLLTEAGGASVVLLSEGVSRAPMFAFENLKQLGIFIDWALNHLDSIEKAANATTRHGELQDVELCVEGTKVYFLFIYTTGDAAGQNMVTLATYAALQWIIKNSPVRPVTAYLESNFSGDKKASALSFQRVRGKKVVAEAIIPADLVKARLHASAEQIDHYTRVGTLGGVMSGTLGTQGHFANGLAALMLACGQDVACVSEAAVGITDIELTNEGDLHACVTLPNLIVGTVGGGTKLPSQRACLELLGVKVDGGARQLAEITAALCLAGELSLIGSIASGEYASAHSRLARGKNL